MSDAGCCDVPAEKSGELKAAPCPTCQKPGRVVELTTVKNLLNPEAMRRLALDHVFRFCAQPNCDTVYFGGPQIFARDDLAVPVFQKDTMATTPACYCFGYSRGDLSDKSRAAEAVATIRGFVKAGKCACETRNPQGACCLANVTALVKAIDQTIKGA